MKICFKEYNNNLKNHRDQKIFSNHKHHLNGNVNTVLEVLVNKRN